MAIKNTLAERVKAKAAKEERVIRQEDIARESGVAVSIVNKYMNNKITLFKDTTLEKFADWLECEPGDLIARSKSATQDSA